MYSACDKLFIGILCAFFCFSSVSTVEASPLKKWFPAIFGPEDTGPKPEETLQAPFATSHAGPSDNTHGLVDMYEAETAKVEAEGNVGRLDLPHLNQEQIGEWAITAVGSALSVKADAAEAALHEKNFVKFYDSYAVQDVRAALAQLNLYAYSKAHNIHVNAFSDGKPRLIQEAVVQGVYRWRMEVPVMLTYVPAQTKTLQGVKTQSQKFIADVQVRRIPAERPAADASAAEKVMTDQGLLIERFSLRAVH